jgi:5-methylcytosine-specific restriction endonuclease McrA
MGLFLTERTFQEIADEINKYIKKKAEGYDTFPYRTDRAVAFQCLNLNLITKEQFEDWDRRRNTLLLQDRSKNFFEVKKRVFERDGNKCVICNSDKNLHFSHIIPFRQTRLNLEIEAITLCEEHHYKFDDGSNEITKAIFQKMGEYYKDYESQYSLNKILCSIHGEHFKIERRI